MLSICCNSRIESWKNPESVTKFKHLINRYKLEGINFPLEKDDWKQFEKNIGTNTLNFLYAKTEEIYPGYVLNIKQIVTLLMIPNREGWCYLAIKNYQHY